MAAVFKEALCVTCLLRWSCSGSPPSMSLLFFPLVGFVGFFFYFFYWSLRASSTLSRPPPPPGPEFGHPSPGRSFGRSWTSRRRPPSPLLLPDLGHVEVEPLEALQRLDVLRVERHVHHHQPVLRSSVVDHPESSQLPFQVHFKTGVDPQK